MPRVPTVTDRATVSPAASRARPPLQRISQRDTTALGRSFLRASQSLQRADVEISAINLSEADAEFTRRLNDHLYNSDDAYFKQETRSAVDNEQDAKSEIDKIRDEVSEELLTGGSDRRIFAANANKRSELAKVKISSHAFRER